MLRAVGHPVAVNPDPELARIAVAEGWPVMHVDRLRRRLRLGGTIAAVAAAGVLTGVALGVRERRMIG
jgi:hypothetical protein